MTAMPESVYFIIGTLVIANVGTIITVLSFIFKAGQFVSETKSGIKNATSMAVRAHKRIDELHNGGEA